MGLDDMKRKAKGKLQQAKGEVQQRTGQGRKGGEAKMKGKANEAYSDAKMKARKKKEELENDF
jgi:uncharacterized protein YjbJ (UPF0337 family)